MKTWLWLILAALIGVVLFWVTGKDPAPPVVAIDPVPMQQSPNVPSARLREFQTAPRAPIAVPPSNVTVTKECEDLFNQVRAVDFKEAFKTAKPGLPQGNCASPPDALKQFHDNYLKACTQIPFDKFPLEQSKQRAEAMAPCYQALSTYRANLTDWLTRNQSLKDIDDPKVLADKLVAKLLEDPVLAGDVAERLLEIEPNLPSVGKTLALSRFLDASTKAKGEHQDAVWNKVDDAVSAARKTNPQDLSLMEMEFVSGMVRHKDPTALRNQIEGARQSNPDSADYLLSWMDYQSQNKEAAVERLKAMQARGSKDPRVASTLARIQQGQKEAHELNVSIPSDVLGPVPATP